MALLKGACGSRCGFEKLQATLLIGLMECTVARKASAMDMGFRAKGNERVMMLVASKSRDELGTSPVPRASYTRKQT